MNRGAERDDQNCCAKQHPYPLRKVELELSWHGSTPNAELTGALARQCGAAS